MYHSLSLSLYLSLSLSLYIYIYTHTHVHHCSILPHIMEPPLAWKFQYASAFLGFVMQPLGFLPGYHYYH